MSKHEHRLKHLATSWESVEKWYSESVGEGGHYYHQKIIIPGVLKLLKLEKYLQASLLDIACGQGILARQIPDNAYYQGIDISPSLIRKAKELSLNSNHFYMVSDVSKPLKLPKQDFTHSTIILALQNIEHPELVLKNVFQHMQHEGRLVIILNHPCFRIPRQSSWKVDEENKIQYRRLDRYYSEMKIPIQMHPSQKGKSPETWSFHHPLSSYCRWLKEAGFLIETIEEWCSDKLSTGKSAKMENRSRKEIPLFMAICAVKIR